MSLANNTDLVAAIAEWLYRTGDTALVARAADFVSLFEADFLIDPDMRMGEMQEIDTTVVASSAVPLPASYLDMIRMRVLGTPDQTLTYVTPQRAAILDASVHNASGNAGVAKNYTIIAGQIFFSPASWAPIGSTLELAYNSFVPLATAPSGVNWLMTKYPNLYLYGSLMQAAAYIDDNETVLKWKAARDEAMLKLTKSERKRKLGGAPLAVTNSVGFRR